MSHFRYFLLRQSFPKFRLFNLTCRRKTSMVGNAPSAEYQTMQTIREKLIRMLETDQRYTTEPRTREHLMKYLPKSQADLPKRKMKDSFDSAIVPLSTDFELRDKYTTFQGSVRLGRLMEDVDLFAGHIAYKHILVPGIPPDVGTPHAVVTTSVSDIIIKDNTKVWKAVSSTRTSGTLDVAPHQPKYTLTELEFGSNLWCCTKHITDSNGVKHQPFPYSIVTIRVDHIELMSHLSQLITDIRLSGHVCWVGSSSLEVIVYLDQEAGGKWERITKALLLMAARNPTNTGPGIVNLIEAETPEEHKLLQGGEKRKLERKQKMNQSLLKTIPSKEELNIIHDLFVHTIDSKEVVLDKRDLPPNSKWMQDATLNNLVFCHPEHRNLYNKIFGGFLIRQALELSWTIAFLYGMRTPKLIHISDIGFYSPVDVGSLLKLYGSVTYTEADCIQVFVFAEALSLSSQELRSTTSFNFTYCLGKTCDRLYPLTYLEAMKYIDGRRHFREYQHLSNDENQPS